MFGGMGLRRTRRTAHFALTMLASVLVLAGCGSSDDSGGTDGSRPLSKREYIEASNELQADAATTFAQLDGRFPATPAAARTHAATFNALIAGHRELVPPADWQDEHDALVVALVQMRNSMKVVARASARNRAAVEYQLGRYQDAQADYEQAVRDINASR
jgi:tetratricopeptide (TPR) repeat protein